MECIWCGGRVKKGRGEHLWSQKLHSEIVQHLPDEADIRSYQALERGPRPSLEKLKVRQGHPYKIAINRVCPNCNNGWMNQLDERVRPTVIELIHGRRVTLPNDEARALASWITMKMMVRDQYDPDTATSNIWIWAGFCESPLTANMCHRVPATARSQSGESIKFGAATTWGLGRLIIFADFFPVAMPPPPEKTVKLWPLVEQDVVLNVPIMDPVEVDRLARRYNPGGPSAVLHEFTFAPDLKSRRPGTTVKGSR